MKLGEKLRQLRETSDKTLVKLASDTGLSVSYLSDLERGRTMPALKTLVKLANVYETSIVGLLFDVELDDEMFGVEDARGVALSSSLSERDERLMRLLIATAQSYFERVQYDDSGRTDETRRVLAIAQWEHPELFEEAQS